LQVQRQPVGYYSYQQHLQRVGGAMAMPVMAFAVQWLLVLLLGFVESRDSKKLKSLEAAKRSMIKELKVCCSGACIPSLQLRHAEAFSMVLAGAAVNAGMLAGTAVEWKRRSFPQQHAHVQQPAVAFMTTIYTAKCACMTP
jgi:hypothetical protein